MLKGHKLVYLVVLWLLLVPATRAAALNIADILTTEELKKAWVLLEMKEYQSAVDMLNGCHDNSKGQPELVASCNFIYARILESKQETAKAIDRYRKAYQYATNDKIKEEALLHRSELNLLKSFNNDAKLGFQTFIRDYPNSRQINKAYLGLAKSLSGLGKPAESLEVLDKSGSNSSEVLFEKANTLQRMGRVKEAGDVYTTALLKDPGYIRKNNDETLYLYGENLLAAGDVKKARAAFSAVKDASLQDKTALGFAKIALKESRPEMAAEHLKKIANSKEREVKQEAMLNLSRVQLQSGKTEDAKKNLKALKGMGLKDKGKEELISLQIDVDVKDKKYKDAAESIKKLHAKDPGSKAMLDRVEGVMSEAMQGDNNQFVDLWLTYGTMLLDKSREPFILRAKDALKDTGKPYMDVLTWISKNSSDTERHKALGELTDIYSDSGDKASAVRSLAEMKNLKVPSDELIRREARINFTNRDYNEALKSAILIKQFNKEDVDLLRDAILMSPKNETAVLTYEKAIKDSGGTTEDYLALADAFYDLGNMEGATGYYKKVLSLEPANQWASYRLGAVLSSQDSEALLKASGTGDSTIDRLSKAALKERRINKRLAEGNF
ncbi:MAG: tetratricopeptide repeat protein [Nitrospirae bacterium]|nr:tetratricopeptide repeat protein [Nitrospirota bacterium]